jgi:putative SOS response-associated peptidase YedK
LLGRDKSTPVLQLTFANHAHDFDTSQGILSRPKRLDFVIVTASAEAGMIDVRDRRPIVLAPKDARLWMDHDLSAEQAEQLACAASLPRDAFAWYRISTDVNNARNIDEHLMQPI